MPEKVDVLAYDEPVTSGDGGLGRGQAMTIATWLVGAVAVGAGVVAGELLVGFVAGGLVLGGWTLFARDDDPAVETRYRSIESGRGEAVVRAHEVKARKRGRMRTVFLAVVSVGIVGYGIYGGRPLVGAFAGGVVAVAGIAGGGVADNAIPRVVESDVSQERAKRLFELETE